MDKQLRWRVLALVLLVLFGIGTMYIVMYNNLLRTQLASNCRDISTAIIGAETMERHLYTPISTRWTELYRQSGHDLIIAFYDQDQHLLSAAADISALPVDDVLLAQRLGAATSVVRPVPFAATLLCYSQRLANQDVLRIIVQRSYSIEMILFLIAFFTSGLLYAFFFAASAGNYVRRMVIDPLAQLTDALNRVRGGLYRHASGLPANAEYTDVKQAFNDMADELERRFTRIQNENTRLSTIVSSIYEGLFAVDRLGKLLLMNNAARIAMGIPETHDPMGEHYSQVIPSETVKGLIRTCMAERRALSAEFHARSGSDIILHATASPLRGSQGCLVLMMDVTQLRKLERVRQEFVSNVTHEFRTPLTSIRGYVETLQAGAINDPQTSKRFLQIIEIEAERLSNLIGDVLSLSEIENRRSPGRVTEVNLQEAVGSVAELLHFTAQHKQVTLHCDVPANLSVQADADRIKQLLLNLVDNAIKYNKEGGEVFISAHSDAQNVTISVRDTGIGISPEHTRRLFERFYRVDKGRSRSIGGTGLGLSIIKHIAGLYNGSVSVKSVLGQGSEFFVTLPITQKARRTKRSGKTAQPPPELPV